MKQLLQLDLINNPVSKLPGYRNQIFLMFPTITILDTLDKGGKDAYTNPSMIQAASRVPDSLFDKSAPVPAPVFIPPPPVSKSPSRLIAPSKSKSKSIKDLPLARKASKSKVVKIDPPVAPVGVKSKKVVHTASKRSKILASSGRSKSSRAGLSFPVARIKRKIKNTSMGLRVGNGSAVYMAAVLEYLTAELLEIAGNEAKKDKKQRIVPSMIRRSLKADEEMNNLLKNVTIGMIG